jgi:hypothetical protein
MDDELATVSAAAPPPLSVRLSRIGGPVHVTCHECILAQYKNRVPSVSPNLQPQVPCGHIWKGLSTQELTTMNATSG